MAHDGSGSLERGLCGRGELVQLRWLIELQRIDGHVGVIGQRMGILAGQLIGVQIGRMQPGAVVGRVRGAADAVGASGEGGNVTGESYGNDDGFSACAWGSMAECLAENSLLHARTQFGSVCHSILVKRSSGEIPLAVVLVQCYGKPRANCLCVCVWLRNAPQIPLNNHRTLPHECDL